MKSVALGTLGSVYCQSRGYARFAHHEIFGNREYIQHGIELAPGATIFDVGANIGLFTLFANQECGRDATIFAFEPIPETYSYLQKNLDTHGLTQRPNVRSFNVGLTHRGGPRRASFSYFRSSSGLSTMKLEELNEILTGIKADSVLQSLKETNPWLYYLALPLYPIREPLVRTVRKHRLRRQEVECNLRTLSEVLREFNIERVDLLKVDVEGAELEVLDGIDEEDWPKLRQVAMEVHDLDGRLDEACKLLRKKGLANVTSAVQHWSRDTQPATYMVYAHQ